MTAINTELVSKWLSLVRDLVPQATTIAFLSGDASYIAYEDQKSQILAAARALGRQVIILETRSDRDYEAAFKTLVRREAGALVVGPFSISQHQRDFGAGGAVRNTDDLPPSRLRRHGRLNELLRRFR